MKILSIDQSTIKSGWSLSFNGKIEFYGTIDLHKVKDSHDKFHQMCMSIHNLIKDNKCDVVVIEDVAMQTNIKTAILLSRLQGSIIQSCLMLDEPYFIITPTQWRKSIGLKQGRVKREELKAQAIEYANTYLGKTDIPEDCAESICMNIAYQKLTM